MNYFKIKGFWERGNRKAFKKLKKELSSNTELPFYDPNKDLKLVADASHCAVDGVLLQEENQNTLTTLCYISRALAATKLQYSITEKEALSLVWCIEKLHLYLCAK